MLIPQGVSRLAHRVQLTSDGHRIYLNAIEAAFGSNVDYAMLVKLYGAGGRETQATYSPAKIISCRAVPICGDPDPEHISTSYVERQNLMRMSMRRFARLTNAFSKKVENQVAALSLHVMYYNLCRVHQTLSVTPAMEAGISDYVWTIEEVVALLGQKMDIKQSCQQSQNGLFVEARQERGLLHRLHQSFQCLTSHPCAFHPWMHRTLNIVLQEARSFFGRTAVQRKGLNYIPVIRSYSDRSPIQRRVLNSYNQARNACILEMASNRPWATRVDLATFLEGWDMGEKWASRTYNLESYIGQSVANSLDS